jgi:hypothetical protein
MADVEPISDDESRGLLREFLRQLKKLLQDLVDNPRPAIPGRHHESMTDAWHDVSVSFDTAINALQPATVTAELQPRGLTGPQLIFKISVFQHARDRLLDHGTAAYGQQKKRRWWALFRRLFTGTLKAGDVILDSLGLIPGIDAIKEFKGSVESGLELGAVSD